MVGKGENADLPQCSTLRRKKSIICVKFNTAFVTCLIFDKFVFFNKELDTKSESGLIILTLY